MRLPNLIDVMSARAAMLCLVLGLLVAGGLTLQTAQPSAQTWAALAHAKHCFLAIEKHFVTPKTL